MSRTKGSVVAIFICPVAGAPMCEVPEVEAIKGVGLKGDRYAAGAGSYNKGEVGMRQVTLMAARFFQGNGFQFSESRRNIIVDGEVELMWLIDRYFTVGQAHLRGVKYCDPCRRPSVLAGKEVSFTRAFLDRGGLIAEVITGGLIRRGDPVVPPPKIYD